MRWWEGDGDLRRPYLEGRNHCGFTGPTDQVHPNLMSSPLADKGGPIQTHTLQPDGQAMDAGDDAVCPAIDQRGVSRPVDGDGNSTATCDIGAVAVW